MKKYLNTIICGDTLTTLKTFPDDFVDTIITSPPYWGLRDYGVKGQIGLEKTLEEYIKKLLEITAELQRVLKPTGVMWWNHGDCYNSSPPGNKPGQMTKQLKEGDGVYGRLIKRYGGDDSKFKREQTNYPTKCLHLQNYRLILQMINQGWILRNTIIWHKPNHMPSSVKDRFTNSYEPVFMLVKNKRYWFDLGAVRVPHTTFENRPMGIDREKDYPNAKRNKNSFNYRVRDAEKKSEQCPQFKASGEEIKRYKTKIPQSQAESFGTPRARNWRPEKYGLDDPKGARRGRIVPNGQVSIHPAGKNPGDVWDVKSLEDRMEDTKDKDDKQSPAYNVKKLLSETRLGLKPQFTYKGIKDDLWRIPTQPFPEAHFATFPEKLVEPMIKSSCPKKKGIVLDPFSGAGTVGVVAKKLGRNYIGIDIKKEYCEIAEKRIKGVNPPLKI